MKKLMPVLRLGAFCFALFGISALAILLKQGRLLQKASHDEEGAEHAAEGGKSGDHPADGEPVKAGLHELGGGPDGGSTHPAPGTEDAKREASLAKGRALFELPEPISITEASDLLLELRRQKADNDARRAALEQRERELIAMEREIEARRLEVLGLAETLHLNTPSAAIVASGEELDPERMTSLAGILSAMQQPEAAARFLENTPTDKAALILLKMDQAKAAEILTLVQGDKLLKLTEMLLKAKETGGE